MTDTPIDSKEVFGKKRAEEEAKVERDARMKHRFQTGTIIAGALAVILTASIINFADLGFAWYVIIAIALILIGRIIKDLKTEKLTTPKFAGYTGMIVGGMMLASLLLGSGPGVLLRTEIETLNDKAYAAACQPNDTREFCREAVIKAAEAVERERQAEIDEAIHEARVEAEEAAAAESVAAATEAALEQTDGQPCAGRWEDMRECESIQFRANQKYDRTTPIGFYLVADDPSKITVTWLGGNDYRIIPIRPNITVRIWEEAA